MLKLSDVFLKAWYLCSSDTHGEGRVYFMDFPKCCGSGVDGDTVFNMHIFCVFCLFIFQPMLGGSLCTSSLVGFNP